MAIWNPEPGEYVISAYHSWRPGVYESERAARYAFRFPDEVLKELQDKANATNGGHSGVITFEMLQKARKT